VHPPAAARHSVQVMLNHLRGHQRDLDLLMRSHHPQVGRAVQGGAALTHPRRECGTVSSGCSLQARCGPRAPGCLPCLRFPPPGCLRGGGVWPGRSSADGGIEELPLLREESRSSRSALAARSVTCPASRALPAASTSITRACTAITASRAASSGIRGTGHHDHDILAVIKPARWASPEENQKT
jgi:hypothetical protein